VEVGVGPRFDKAGVAGVDFTLSLEQSVEMAGQRSAREQAASWLGKRLDSELNLAAWQLRRELTQAYRSALVERERLTVARSLVNFARDMQRVAERRFHAGELSVIDLRIATSDVAQARQALIAAELALRTACLRLCELSGWPLGDPPAPAETLPAPAPVPELAQLMAATKGRHPELSARRIGVAEAQARTRVAEREAWASPVLGVSLSREAHRTGERSEGPNYIVLGTLGLALPFWQQNQMERGRAHADAAVARAETSAEESRLQVRVARAHAQLSAAVERVRLFGAEVAPALEDSLELLRRGMEAGEIPLLTVAVARERFLQSQRSALDAYADYFTALAEFEYVAGVTLPDAPGVTP
jgi:cobalt-zinc-cadmium efflux system outer membrane protein